MLFSRITTDAFKNAGKKTTFLFLRREHALWLGTSGAAFD